MESSIALTKVTKIEISAPVRATISNVTCKCLNLKGVQRKWNEILFTDPDSVYRKRLCAMANRTALETRMKKIASDLICQAIKSKNSLSHCISHRNAY